MIEKGTESSLFSLMFLKAKALMFRVSLTSIILIRKNLNNAGDKNYIYLFVIVTVDICSVRVCKAAVTR